jgi:hypothetical protein
MTSLELFVYSRQHEIPIEDVEDAYLLLQRMGDNDPASTLIRFYEENQRCLSENKE